MSLPRCYSVLPLMLAVAVLLLVGDRAWADVRFFPIPAVSTSENDGNDAGFIVPILVTDPSGDLKYLVAPMFVVNSILGARGTLNIFRYDSEIGRASCRERV